LAHEPTDVTGLRPSRSDCNTFIFLLRISKSMRKEFRSLLPLDEARSIVLSHLPKVEEETVPLECALGRVLAEKVVSEIDVPSFDRASMDGYAVRMADTLEAREDRPVSLQLAGNVPMGAIAEVEVCHGQAAEVSTGSMMPFGADAVVMIEYSEVEGDRVHITKPVHEGENILRAGSDIMFGDVVLLPGTRLAAREIGVLAAVSRSRVRVRRLLVGIASTGNELSEPGKELEPGHIYDINSYSIAAAALECGATPVSYGILPDDHRAMAEALQRISRECSMILVSGSTSAGAGDMVYQVLDELGETFFHGVNLKPGKPTIFGSISGRPILGLPGYPTSALTVFGQLAAPAIRKALGLKISVHRIAGRLTRPIRTDGRHQLLAVGVSGDLVYPVDKGSGSITTLSMADGVIEIPSSVEYLPKGQAVEVQLFGELAVADVVVAGENCPFMELIAESMPFQIRFITNGTKRGIISVEDWLADVACISGQEEYYTPNGFALVCGYKRELGLMGKDLNIPDSLQQDSSIVGWSRYSEMDVITRTALLDLGLDPGAIRFVGQAKSHSAVAAAVASGRANFGFGAMVSADNAGLGFQKLMSDRIDFLIAVSSLEKEGVQALISNLKTWNQKDRLPAGILMDENAGSIIERPTEVGRT
jgi:putative molybdopterin biosynthesis protein